MKQTIFALLLITACASKQEIEYIAVPDTTSQRGRIDHVIATLDGLDETATDAAIEYAHKLAKTELQEANFSLAEMQWRLQNASVQYKNLNSSYDSCFNENEKLRIKIEKLANEGGFFARLGLRWSWFFYGVGTTIIMLIVGSVVAYVSGWITKLVGFIR